MPVDGIYLVKYGKPLGRPPMAVPAEIVGEYLAHFLLYVRVSHTFGELSDKVR